MRTAEITAPITEADTHRFWAKVAIDPSGCLLWTASTRSGGYGQFSHGGRMVQAHRFAYTALVGPIPDGLVLDHLCRIRACVAPDHLESVTNRTNVLRGVGPSAVAASRTHCPAGHAYDEANTSFDKHGKRSCRECNRRDLAARLDANREQINERKRAWYAANREKVREQQRADYAANREAKAAAARLRVANRRAASEGGLS